MNIILEADRKTKSEGAKHAIEDLTSIILQLFFIVVVISMENDMGLVQITEVMGNVGEFIGSFAVLATLVYLTLQIRQSRQLMEENRRMALSEVHQARMDSRLGLHRATAQSDFATILVKLDATNFI